MAGSQERSSVAAAPAARGRGWPAFLAVLAAALAFGYAFNPRPSVNAAAIHAAQARLVAKAAAAASGSSPSSSSSSSPAGDHLSVALGYNVCVDAILRWDGVLDGASAAAAAGAGAPRDVAAVRSAEDLHACLRTTLRRARRRSARASRPSLRPWWPGRAPRRTCGGTSAATRR
jgi:hypothetical protein